MCVQARTHWHLTRDGQAELIVKFMGDDESEKYALFSSKRCASSYLRAIYMDRSPRE